MQVCYARSHAITAYCVTEKMSFRECERYVAYERSEYECECELLSIALKNKLGKFQKKKNVSNCVRYQSQLSHRMMHFEPFTM